MMGGQDHGEWAFMVLSGEDSVCVHFWVVEQEKTEGTEREWDLCFLCFLISVLVPFPIFLPNIFLPILFILISPGIRVCRRGLRGVRASAHRAQTNRQQPGRNLYGL